MTDDTTGETAPLPSSTPSPGPSGDSAAGPPRWRHPLQLSHLVMGLAFAGLGVLWALVTADVVTGAEVRWLLPVPWLVAGAAGLVAWVVAQRRSTSQ